MIKKCKIHPFVRPDTIPAGQFVLTRPLCPAKEVYTGDIATRRSRHSPAVNGAGCGGEVDPKFDYLLAGT